MARLFRLTIPACRDDKPYEEIMMGYEHSRAVPRYPFSVTVDLTAIESGFQISARTTDLSQYGCGVQTLQTFSKGTIVGITLSHAGSRVAALGRVIYANPKLGMGVVFSRIEREDMRVLQEWIAKLMDFENRDK
ncbi:MAG TPA: PilZ domain-containing protein [Candidatus Acidoferrales bacterium]|jgi:hypothetical protein|nr:PilZ domain-containing protein [Candidatus Acidoferrales bacterium]